MRVLLVEDYAPLRKAVSKGLCEAGFAVDVAEEGEEGLWLAQTIPYDVILLDIMLPNLDGLTILQRIRRNGRDASVLLLTAKDAVGDRVDGLNAGADDYLVKPFAFEELLARVNALVRRRYDCRATEIRIGRLVVDTVARRVFLGEQEVRLTAREYSLLEYLALRAGQTVSRTDIWEHVYDFASSATSNVVDVYIGYLRKKLDQADEVSLIRTVRGQGYTLGGAP